MTPTNEIFTSHHSFKSILIAFLFITACADDKNETVPMVSFTETTLEVSESTGTFVVEVSLTKTLSESLIINFSTMGSASRNGDYSLDESLSLTIPPGETSGELSISIIDDVLIESTSDELILELSTINTLVTLDETRSKLSLQILDNDEVPSEALQTDLSWNLGEGEDIDAVDLNLYYVTDVVIENSSITDFNVYTGSVSESGFESLSLYASEPDNAYYLAVVYAEGEQDIDFTLTLNSQEFVDETIGGTFEADEVGYGIFYGPISKNGSSFERTALRRAGRFKLESNQIGRVNRMIGR